jgi:hypothetical protein
MRLISGSCICQAKTDLASANESRRGTAYSTSGDNEDGITMRGQSPQPEYEIVEMVLLLHFSFSPRVDPHTISPYHHRC